MSDHALLSASGAHKWIPCPGSLALERGVPNESSTYADEGTDAHELAALTLSSVAKQTFAFEGRVLSKGFTATKEMCEFVQQYVDLVLQYSDGHTLLIEQKVNYAHYLGVAKELAWGTSDAVVVTADGEELMVIDLKYGSGVEVDAEDNEQLMLYALGALYEYEMLGDFKRVRMIISQPRRKHLSEIDCSVPDLLTFAAKAKASAQTALQVVETHKQTGKVDIKYLNAGEDQCRFCRFKKVKSCPGRDRRAQEELGAEFDDIMELRAVPVPKLAIPALGEDLAKRMKLIEIIKDWWSSEHEMVSTAIYTELMKGGEVPGYKLILGNEGDRAWRNAAEAEKAMKAMRLKLAEMYTQKIISPTVAEKLLKKNNPKRWAALQKLIFRSEARPTVAGADHKKPAYVPVAAASDDEFDEFDNFEIMEDLV